MRRVILGTMVFIGLAGWAQMQPAPTMPLPIPPPPPYSDILLEYILPPFPFEEPPLAPPAPLLQVPQGINNFSLMLGQDFSTNLSSDFSQDLSTNLAVDLSEDLSVSLAVNHGRDLSTNLSVNLSQSFAVPTWR